MIEVIEVETDGDVVMVDVTGVDTAIEVIDVVAVDTSPQVIDVLVPAAPGPPGPPNQGTVVMTGYTPPFNPQVGWVWVRPTL